MERNQRTSLQGTVTSIKNDKTIRVTVSTERNASLYSKRVGYSKNYYAHDEKNVAKVGDVVTIVACRPISKTKRFRLVSIDKHVVEIAKAEAVEATLEEQEGIKVEPVEEKKEAKAEKPAAPKAAVKEAK